MGKPTKIGDLFGGVLDEIRTSCENAGVSNETSSTGNMD